MTPVRRVDGGRIGLDDLTYVSLSPIVQWKVWGGTPPKSRFGKYSGCNGGFNPRFLCFRCLTLLLLLLKQIYDELMNHVFGRNKFKINLSSNGGRVNE